MDALVADSGAPETGPPDEGSQGGSHQFVIFHVQDELFAVTLAEVQEIIRMPDVVRVPMSPPALEGLANLRGTVLPIISLRQAFHFPMELHDDATRVVVLDQGRPVGLVVDRMSNVISIEPDRIEETAGLQAGVATDLLLGMIKGEEGRSMMMILDAAQLVRRELRDRIATTETALAPSGEPQGEEKRQAAASVEEDQLVSFDVAGQEYAFPIEQVEEIVQLPDQVTHVPNTQRHVLGVITLRNRLLPLVSLREMFGLPPAELSDANKVVVVSLGEGGQSVGVVMDSVREVLRVNRGVVDPVPTLLSQGQGLHDVSAICRLQDGKRLVSILSAERMFDVQEMQKVVVAAEEDDMAVEIAADMAADLDEEEQFVVFRVMDEEYGVPIAAVQEIVRVPSELTRVPKTAAFIEGVINLRGVVLPVVDQRRRFGLPSLERNDRQRIMVFTVRGVRTGFIVDSVSEVMRIPARFIGATPDLSEEQKRLINRVANLEAQKRMILLLEATQLLDITEAATLAKQVAGAS
jgi:purine-binding chemotaxis protein CheW